MPLLQAAGGVVYDAQALEMELRNLGSSGLRVSVVGLGCNNFGGRLDVEGSRRVIDHAIDLGITLFDTADVYGNRGGSETILGQVLGARRERIVLASKFGLPMDDDKIKAGASRRYIMAALDASLKRLQTDYLDLYQLHTPDPRTPIEETLSTLDDIVRAGKARYVGCSNLPAWQVADAQWTARQRGFNAFISCQDEYSLVVRGADRDLIPAITHFGMGLLPYFPLASGLLTGKYRRDAAMPVGARLTNAANQAERYLTERNWQIVEHLEAFCAARQISLLELAFGWLLARPGIASVIAGATKPEQLEANVAAAAWKPSLSDLEEIDRLTAV
jgi:aryl-alcohol dehydrogenase-like predicted oxidoreductase